MRGSAAVVVAGCDGATSEPVVVGDGGSGTDVASGFAREDGSVTVTLTGNLDVGSTLTLATLDGTVVAETEVSSGSVTTVTVPGPDNVVLVLLGLDGGVPLSELVQTPSGATLGADPRVTSSGSTVRVFGVGCAGIAPGTVEVAVTGESDDWYDAPTGYLRARLTAGPDGSWETQFAMPAEVVQVVGQCTLDGEPGRSLRPVVVGAVDAPSDPLQAVRDGDDVLVVTPHEGEAFALDGRALITEGSPGGLRVRDAPDRFLVVAYVLFGTENADPDVVTFDTPAQWLVDVSPPLPPAPSDPPDPVAPPAAAPARGGAELAATGPVAVDQSLLALLLLAAGAGCLLVSRRGPRRRRSGAPC